MFVEVVRLFIAVLIAAAGYWIAREYWPSYEPLGGIAGLLVGYVAGGLVGRLLTKLMTVVEKRTETKPAGQVLAGSLGAVLGVLLGIGLAIPLLILTHWWISIPAVGLLAFVLGYFGFAIFAKQSEELFKMAGLSTRPLIRATPYDQREGFLVDSSAVMDGQLLPLIRAKIISADLMVARFVLDELQGLADMGDNTQGRRAKRGLEVLDLVRKSGSQRLYVLDDELPEFAEVDAKLVALAKRLKIPLLSNDTNLERVAELQGVPVTNLRRLVSELSPERMPGEILMVEIVKAGKEPGQGVGYLDDGSMAVVNGGDDLIGKGAVNIEVSSVVPTRVGKIVFAVPYTGMASMAETIEGQLPDWNQMAAEQGNHNDPLEAEAEIDAGLDTEGRK